MRISVIIPSFNSSHYIERTVESLVKTGYPSLEMLVVDDGSVDSGRGSSERAKIISQRQNEPGLPERLVSLEQVFVMPWGPRPIGA
jgi:cellulose synthase/poly-beta-1,6-N-acetylglucosamine synthase-like glycosyltransferase